MEIKAIVKFKHQSLITFLQNNNITNKQFAEIAGTSYASILLFLNLAVVPRDNMKNKITDAILKIDSNAKLSDIFPDNLKTIVRLFHPRDSIKTISPEMLVEYEDKKFICQDNALEIMENKSDAKKVLKSIMEGATTREKQVVFMYFYEQKTFREIAQKIGRTPERARGILNKFLRRATFRHDIRKIKREINFDLTESNEIVENEVYR